MCRHMGLFCGKNNPDKEMNFDVTIAVRAFLDLLSRAWPVIEEVSANDSSGSFVDDWLQANWERVVESFIPPSMAIAIEPYGNGADCNIRSSRVWKPDLLPTSPVFVRYIGNDILCNSLSGEQIVGEMKIDYFFVLWKADGRSLVLPFDHLLFFGI